MLDKPLFVGKNRDEFSEFYGDADQFDNMSDGRIPALITLKNGKYAGTVIAAADKASCGADWGRIEIAVRRSTDGGNSFSPMKTLFSPPVRRYPRTEKEYSSAFAIDPLLLENSLGELILLVDFYPECKGLHAPRLLENGSGYIVKDGEQRLLLFSRKSALDSLVKRKGTVFTLHSDGFVYDPNGEQTRYYIPKNHSPSHAFATFGDMYYRKGSTAEYLISPPPLVPEYSENGDIYVGNIYLSKDKPEFSPDFPLFVQKKPVYADNGELLCVESAAAPLRVSVTSYLFMLKSCDGGETFSQPEDITPFVKKDRDCTFLGVGPGVGLRLRYGKYAGRLLVPVYALGRAGVLISDTDGKTWRRGRELYCENIDESQLIETPGGRIFCFGRPAGGGNIPLSVSEDAGESFGKLPPCPLFIPQCQHSVISLPPDFILPDGMVNDGFYFLVSAPTGHSGKDTTRTRGKVFMCRIEGERVFVVRGYDVKDENKYAVFGKYTDFYAYSCLSILPGNKIGLLYEGYPSGYIAFASFGLDR